MKNRSWLVAVLLAPLVGLTACSSEHKVSASVPETVSGLTTLTIQENTIPDSFDAVGTVRASRTSPLAAQVMGNIAAVNVREGDSVRQGQTLVVIDDTQPRAAVAQAEAALVASDHEIAAAEAELTLAQTTFNRLKWLYEKGTISAQEYDQSKSRFDSARARRDLGRATRAQAAAALEQAKIVLGHTQVRAPYDGVITERKVDPGALASPGLPLLTVDATGHYRLEASMDESDLKFARLGAKVPVAIDALDGQPLNATVTQIVPAADPASRSFIVKLELPANPSLRSGLFGRARFIRGEKKAIMIPRSAVIEHGQLQSVWVLGTDNIAALRYVTLGKPQQDLVEVLSGLSAGETLVSAPAGRDLSGKRIEVR